MILNLHSFRSARRNSYVLNFKGMLFSSFLSCLYISLLFVFFLFSFHFHLIFHHDVVNSFFQLMLHFVLSIAM